MTRVFSFIFRHPKSGILYFRYAVPTKLRGVVGRREIKRSLYTTEKSVAIPLAMRLYCDLQYQFQQIRGELLAKPKKKNDGIPDGFLGKITFDTLELPGVKAENVVIDSGNDEKDLTIAKSLLRVAPGSEQDFPAKSAKSVPSGPVSNSPPLIDVAIQYRKEKLREGSWTDKTYAEHEALHELLRQIIGNKHVDAITHADGRKLKEALLRLPPNMTKGVYSGKTVKQIIAMIPEKTLSPRTINEKLQRASSLFQWAVRQGFCQIDPFGGLKLKIKRKASEEREAFSAADLMAIFNPDHFSQDKLRHEWQYWIPILALYTGCRVQELAQLRCKDVFEEDRIYALNITPDAGKLKNVSSERRVPLHPKVIEAGFLDYVVKMSDIEGERLFPELYKVKKKPGDTVGNWFNRVHLKNVGIKSPDRKISFHSFRHSFTNAFKQLDVPETKVKALTGHAHEGVTYSRYGKDYPLPALFEVVKMLDYNV